MDYKQLVNTAVLAGEILLRSGSEIYRVEDTMNHILKTGGSVMTEAYVISTGFVVTLADEGMVPLTVAKRVDKRVTNLAKVYEVNSISREYCEGRLSLTEAYNGLKAADNRSGYPTYVKHLGTIGTTAFFTLILGGRLAEVLLALLAGILLAFTLWGCDTVKMNGFCRNGVGAMAIALFIMTLDKLVPINVYTDVIITGAIMPMVPGVLFTTAIRDTLHGDYLSGCSRMVEAVVVALGIAVGVGTGMFIYQYFI